MDLGQGFYSEADLMDLGQSFYSEAGLITRMSLLDSKGILVV